ncbi:MAG: polysaccharide deacetylase family protein, partial [Ferruginibacter sp.]
MQAVKRTIDKNIPYLIDKIGYLINPLILNFKNENNHLLIFYFHGVYKSQKEKDLAHADPQNNITVSQLEEFIDYFLHHNYHFLKPEDLLSDLRSDQAYIMITFDDGYFNNTLALDVLNRYKVPAVFFITTKNVVENKSFWWDIIYKFRIKEHISLEAIRKEQVYLKSFKYPYINQYIEENFGASSTKPWSDIDRPMNAAELNEISKNPFISIGNHTHNHSILTNYNSDEIKEEFNVSNRIILDITGKLPISTAFPNGNFNNLVLKTAEEMEFRFAFTTKNSINILP